MKLKPLSPIRSKSAVRLSKFSPTDTGGLKSEQAAAPILVKHLAAMDQFQEVLYAGRKKAVLIVLQGMDGSGKDGTVRHIFSGINPQGCDVTSFKVPTPLEARHDFLWRAHAAVPPLGNIGIFNRSHYEDVLSPWVHKVISSKLARRRLEDINKFEQTLTDNGVVILKFFLHISHEEQTRRLQSRLDDPDKHWKLDPADFEERRFWPQYAAVYEEILSSSSHKHAPWFVVPSDHKWYRNLAISTILVSVLKDLKLKYPKPVLDPTKFKL